MTAMDDLTHALAGTLMARTHPSKKRGLALACVFGSLIPDIDIVLTLWGRDFYVTEHRGFTHSLWGLLPMSFLAAGAAWLWVRKKEDGASFPLLWFMAGLGVVSHILLDWCTSWGTMIFWPNRTRFSLDHLFIIDLWYMAILALPIAFSFYRKEYRVRICVAGIACTLAYHALVAFNHQKAVALVGEGHPGAWTAAFPQPFSPFRWSAYEREKGLLRNARIDFLKSAEPLEWNEWQEPLRTAAVQAAMDSPRGRDFLWFARVPMWREEAQADGSTAVYFWDLRFNGYGRSGQESHRFGERFIVKDGKVTQGGF
ncbi:MAG TPA: metal-dependent hydrolase [bacterium]|jgi:membrane-bound metal-dependent hydrolase YbcI (DUF457 family)|nr:metal-dependent hydrolase [bacterium]